MFKPELESRLGLSELSLGGTAYVGKQTTANLNLATQDTAGAFVGTVPAKFLSFLI